MYIIFTYTYHKNQPNVGKYSEVERLKEIDPKIELGVFAGLKLFFLFGGGVRFMCVPLEVRIGASCHPNIRPL